MIRILYAKDRTPAPWKNGGGTTTEVAAFPPSANLESFGWRISIAEIASDGPFSIFPQIDRSLALFRGGLALAIAGRKPVSLSTTSPPCSFPGDIATHATLTAGPATDLNVMTRRNTFTAQMTRKTLSGTFSFNTDAAATFAFPLEPVSVTANASRVSLSPRDAIHADAYEKGIASLSNSAEFYWIELTDANKPSE